VKAGIALKLALLLAAVGALVAGLTGLYAYQSSQQLLVESAQGKLLTSTQVLARRITLSREEIARNLLVLAKRFGLPFELIEIGSSAGLNLLIDRYRYDLGGVVVGPGDAPVTIAPEWRGRPPPVADVRIASVRGVDIAPIDAADPDAAERLLAYVWADTPERSARVEAAIAMIRERPVSLEQGDAADFVEAQLASPQAPGTMRVLMHSIVWQYLPPATQARITAAMERAGAAASAERPLAWVQFENGWTRHVGVRCWPEGAPEVELAKAHPHGTWIEWSGIDLPLTL